jgi:hypothetical protein
MQDIKESLDQSRRKMLIGFAIGYVVWRGMYIINRFLPDSSILTDSRIFFVIISLTGWLLWTYYLVRLMRFVRIIKKDPSLNDSLNNEYIQYIRLKSIAVAFFILLLVQMILLFISKIIVMNASVIIDINILTAVLSLIIAFLFFDRDR